MLNTHRHIFQQTDIMKVYNDETHMQKWHWKSTIDIDVVYNSRKCNVSKGASNMIGGGNVVGGN